MNDNVVVVIATRGFEGLEGFKVQLPAAFNCFAFKVQLLRVQDFKGWNV